MRKLIIERIVLPKNEYTKEKIEDIARDLVLEELRKKIGLQFLFDYKVRIVLLVSDKKDCGRSELNCHLIDMHNESITNGMKFTITQHIVNFNYIYTADIDIYLEHIEQADKIHKTFGLFGEPIRIIKETD